MGRIKDYLRHVRTTQERREWFASDAPLRGARSPKNLPTYWSDIWRKTQRSWKKFRKTQWKI